jgi:hypothetical protein
MEFLDKMTKRTRTNPNSGEEFHRQLVASIIFRQSVALLVDQPMVALLEASKQLSTLNLSLQCFRSQSLKSSMHSEEMANASAESDI